MKRFRILKVFLLAFLFPAFCLAYEVDTIKTPDGELKITFVGHASIFVEFGGKVIHIDPVSQYGDYGKFPKAHLILITHEHYDHFDPRAISAISKKDTIIIANPAVARLLPSAIAMRNGEEKTVLGLKIMAVPAYNISHRRPTGVPYHPKGEGNGYLLTMGKTRLYIGGDTENIPEMKALKDIDIAFLPMNLPYTMTPEMVADAARAFRPRILYPYHYGETDVSRLVELMKGEKGIDVRIRKMQ